MLCFFSSPPLTPRPDSSPSGGSAAEETPEVPSSSVEEMVVTSASHSEVSVEVSAAASVEFSDIKTASEDRYCFRYQPFVSYWVILQLLFLFEVMYLNSKRLRKT